MPGALAVGQLAEGKHVVSRHRLEVTVGKGATYFVELDTWHVALLVVAAVCALLYLSVTVVSIL